MNGSAVQREESTERENFLATGTDGAPSFGSGAGFESGAALDGALALKQMAAERLAAHRNRRAAVAATQAEREANARARAEAARRENNHGASRVRETVAARYRQSVSYREYLAAEAERALEQAQAEAEVAARNARAVAEAQMQLLAELEQWNEPAREPSPREQAIAEQRAAHRGELAHALADIALGARELIAEPPSLSIVELPSTGSPDNASAGLKVRLHEQLGGPVTASALHSHNDHPAYARAGEIEEFEELDQLDQEIEFRAAPEFEYQALDATPIQANIIEFPRQLVAPRRARPRLAEGPLREDGPAEPQLRIFEVEPEQISAEPVAAEASGAPEWQGLLLDAVDPQPVSLTEGERDARLHPQTAPLAQRMMALAVDACCVGVGFVAFSAVVAEIAGPALRGLPLPALGGAAVGTVLTFALLYQMLFFSVADATPGMRYARIGLCTFNDESPSRRAMRGRIFAMLLALCPLGLGIVWMALDDDRLGWHDRISRMYPRSY
jgi:uncharacterized RDD family membrane protein YckC